LFGFALLIGGYFVLNPLIGKSAALLMLFPLYYFASLYGRWGGVAAAALAIPFNLVMYYFVGGAELVMSVSRPFWTSSLVLIPMFYQVGYGQELRRRLTGELARSHSLTEQLREERDRVRQASKAKDTLLMSISHDLRSPVSAIIQSAQLIEAAPHAATEQADLIRRTGHRLLEVVNDLLKGYRKLAQPQSERSAPFDLQGLLEEIVQLNRPLFAAHHLTLELRIAPELPHWLDGHAAVLHRILANLLGNSLKYTESGGARLQASAVVVDGGERQLQIAVIDSGKGIPPHRIGSLLAAARAAPVPTAVTDKPGYGLGLGNCLRLCDQIGARLELRPNHPRGLQALLRLPWRPARPADEPPESAPATATATTPLGAGPHTLIVDDEEATAATLAAMLQELGCRTAVAADGASARRELDARTFPLAFLDLQLPDMDGRRLAAEWRQRAPATFLVLFSANILLTDLDLWLNLDVDLILSKPITLHELGQLIALSDSAPGKASSPSDCSDDPPGELSGRHRQLLREYLEQCLFAYGRQDLNACSAQAHKIANAAGTLQLGALTELAARVEALAEAGQRIPLFPGLRRLAAATRAATRSA
jgi:two-component system capsular synthesis sensor histidine kinase RcsC